ncbi:hypothetical protein Poly24_00390 [Rosistilla carotiformis]|uniref:Uncharacterized protein n=1 Tax=Rosistilla carotiformis TaxID=2528017 RepID=A0A518JLC7_9BACT|nr:hypothetical protein Poly24_00390 [Rosistilla carotiformis]
MPRDLSAIKPEVLHPPMLLYCVVYYRDRIRFSFSQNPALLILEAFG